MRPNEPRINEKIRAVKVRLIDANNDMLGITDTREAVDMARDAGLDLVEVSPNADPPVCKIIDYGKYKYDQQKRANEARKKQKVVHLKEIKLRPNIDSHDLGVKMNNVRKFIAAGDKVKFSLRFRGREMTHQQIGMEILEGIKEELGDTIKVEYQPRLEGRQMVMIIAPATS